MCLWLLSGGSWECFGVAVLVGDLVLDTWVQCVPKAVMVDLVEVNVGF